MNKVNRTKELAQYLLDHRGEDWALSRYFKGMRGEYGRLLIVPTLLLVLAFVWDNSLVAALAAGILFGLALREARAIKISKANPGFLALVIDWDKVQELAGDDTDANQLMQSDGGSATNADQPGCWTDI